MLCPPPYCSGWAPESPSQIVRGPVALLRVSAIAAVRGHPSMAEAVVEISSAPNETLLRGVWYKKVSYFLILPELEILQPRPNKRARNRGAVAQRCAEVYRQHVPGNRKSPRNTLSDIAGEQWMVARTLLVLITTRDSVVAMTLVLTSLAISMAN